MPGLVGARSVSLGRETGCAVDGTGAISCWGAPEVYYTRDGEPVPPARFPPSTGNWALVEVADPFACALDQWGEVCCWGEGYAGDCSDPLPPGPFVSLAASFPEECPALKATGRPYACGLRPEGTVECWGEEAPPQGLVSQLQDVVEISLCDWLMALHSDGTPTAIRINDWGRWSWVTEDWVMGASSTVRRDPQHGLWYEAENQVIVPHDAGAVATFEEPVLKVRSEGTCYCFLAMDGRVDCLPDNERDPEDCPSPSPELRFTDLSMGGFLAGGCCGATADGRVGCWCGYDWSTWGP